MKRDSFLSDRHEFVFTKLLTSYVSFSKFLNLFDSQFPHVPSGEIFFPELLQVLSEKIYVKFFLT